MNSAVGEPTAEITEWTSVADLKNLRWYFRTREDQSIRMVDLKEALTAAKGDVAAIEMEVTRQPYANVSRRSEEARPSRELGAAHRRHLETFMTGKQADGAGQ